MTTNSAMMGRFAAINLMAMDIDCPLRIVPQFETHNVHYQVWAITANKLAPQAAWCAAIGKLYKGAARITTKSGFNMAGKWRVRAYANGRYIGRWCVDLNKGSIIGWFDMVRG